MTTIDLITIVFNFVAIVAITAFFVYFIVKNNRRSRRISSLLKSHPMSVMALLDCDNFPQAYLITREQARKILSLSDSDWNEWESLRQSVISLAEKFPHTLYDFINSSFPTYKDRANYKNRVNLFTPITQRVMVAVASLYLDELRQIDADPDSVWLERDKLRTYAGKIRQKYPEGFRTYCDIHKVKSPKDSVVVRDKKHIAELQKLYDESIAYDGWEKKQEEFSTEFSKILKDIRSQDGRYDYDVSFNKPSRMGTLIESKFKIWQGFCESFSSFLLERQEDVFKARYDKISEFEICSRHFIDRVYDQIFEIILKFGEKVEGDLNVILIDRCNRNWSKRTYDYHYRRIREKIGNSDIMCFNYSDLPNVNDNGNVGGIFILDFITSNEELKNNCRLIAEHFNKSAPLLGYYSLIKEFEEKELLNLAEKHEGYLRSEKNDIEFIKDCLLRVKKHSFYSYIAIPNTWIGEAANAKVTKRLWLENPNMYEFKIKKEAGHISGEFSIDGGFSFEDISIEGDSCNVDDTAKFTYLLFKKMGVFSLFKKEGRKAIDFMNEHDILTYH